MTRVEIAPAAQDELEEIIAFIAADSPAAAERVRVAIRDAIARLGEWPGLGHAREDLTARPLRFWSVMGRYTIVYATEEERVRIVRLFGPGQDIAHRL
jgi:plasmid stabilization system protein ParE